MLQVGALLHDSSAIPAERRLDRMNEPGCMDCTLGGIIDCIAMTKQKGNVAIPSVPLNLAATFTFETLTRIKIIPCRLRDLTDDTASMLTPEDTAAALATVVAAVEGTPHLATAAKATAVQRRIHLLQPKEEVMDRNTDNMAVVLKAIRYDYC